MDNENSRPGGQTSQILPGAYSPPRRKSNSHHTRGRLPFGKLTIGPKGSIEALPRGSIISTLLDNGRAQALPVTSTSIGDQMSGTSSAPSAPTNPTHMVFRQENSRWLLSLIKVASAALILILCAYYFAPKIARVQTAFYLTLLPTTLLLLCWRRNFQFLYAWQFVTFLLPPLLLAVSTLWADNTQADVFREPGYYFKLVAYLALFYCCLYFVLEQKGEAVLERWLLWLIPAGLISAIASLFMYGQDGGFSNLRRIGGISLEGDIDKTGMLYGFHALFCCYGLMLESRRWRLISAAALLASCTYIFFSQTKIPIVMATVSLLLAVCTLGSKAAKGLLVLIIIAAVPLGYQLAFGDLPLLQRSNAYSIRIELWSKALEGFAQSPWIGNGLSHKVFLDLHTTLPHPHNYLVDIARFCGLLGLAAFLWQLASVGLIVLRNYREIDWLKAVYIGWFGFGVLAMLVYAQQPLTKPNYMWFFYWIPLAVLLVLSQLRSPHK
ncbi:O-antigen ligase family protein [Microbulbifer elongatus]|uniref:O-antigen ligase family protein n=1 Tax=Microbulbifer elongatus TaxID=86173 RepID=A0ABT1NYC6_9GAMM|nr:O-antigen ligase family protein [Microbulbifer elongatus]MCQ3828843.1 O-antigen ligase family protein [Microbulbifer elongatus]